MPGSAELRKIFLVHDDKPFIAVFDESNIGFDEARLNVVVAQAWRGSRVRCIPRPAELLQ